MIHKQNLKGPMTLHRNSIWLILRTRVPGIVTKSRILSITTVEFYMFDKSMLHYLLRAKFDKNQYIFQIEMLQWWYFSVQFIIIRVMVRHNGCRYTFMLWSVSPVTAVLKNGFDNQYFKISETLAYTLKA